MRDAAIRLICFDLGGVLVRIIHDWAEAYRAGGVRIPKNEPTGLPHHDPAFHALIDEYETGRLDEAEFFNVLVEKFRVGRVQNASAMLDAVLKGAYPGIDGMLVHLHERGFKTACLSNTNARHWHTMTNGAVYKAISSLNHQFASHLIGVRKPEPGIYQHVEEVTGQPPEAILFFDDKQENIDAAVHRGWHAARIDPHNDPVRQIREELQRRKLW